MAHSFKNRISLIAGVVLLGLTSTARAHRSLDRIAGDQIQGPIVESQVRTLLGNVHPSARAEWDQGAISEQTRMDRMMLLLKPSAAQQNSLDTLVQAQQDPGSLLYHKWLSPEEYGIQFGASTTDVSKITQWLRSHGFAVESVAASRQLAIFSGTAGMVEEGFHTQIHSYVVEGQRHIANSQDPQIPAVLAGVVAGIVSLHDFRRVSDARKTSIPNPTSMKPEYTQGTAHFLFPADFAAIYDLNPQYAVGKTGAGVSIAIVGRSNINTSDVQMFRGFSGLPTTNLPTVILNGPNPGLVPGDQDEATLDVEWAGGVAPGAAVKYVVSRSTATTDGVDLSAQYIVNNRIANVMSASFGNCEANMGDTELAFYNSLWQQAAVEGISAFVSSGDSGAAGCTGGSASKGSGAGVNGLCSSPYATCVGGTTFKEGSSPATYWEATNGVGQASAKGYVPEQVWNESGSNGGSGLWSSGGGVSRTFSQPNWQKGISGASSNGMRAVPDVSLTAASHDGYWVCLNGSWYIFAGTSASSPSFAGIMAIISQNKSGVGQGNVNPVLYGLVSAATNPFHATPSGNNSVPGVAGFVASGAAYNLATGLGSVDGNLLVRNWPSPPAAAPSYTLTPSVKAVSVMVGKSATFTVSMTGNSSFVGAVALTATSAAGVSISFSPLSVLSGGSATATVVVGTNASAGTAKIVITGANGTLKQTCTAALTVVALPTLTLTAAQSTITVAQGKRTALKATITGGGSYSGLVVMSVAGLPSGITASWNYASFTPYAGNSISVVTLTLAASTTAPLTTSNFQIIASGAGLQSTAQMAVQVVLAPAIQLALSTAQATVAWTGSQQIAAEAKPVGGVIPSVNLTGVTFAATGLPTGVTAAWGAPVLSSTGTVKATVTLTGSNKLIAGKWTPTLSAGVKDAISGLVYPASQAFTLTTTVPIPTLTLTAAASSVTVQRGQTATLKATITTGGSYAGLVALTLSGLPAGVTANWNPGTYTPASNTSSTVSTLTLTATASAALTTSSLQIVAKGGGLQSTAQVAFLVVSAPVIRLRLRLEPKSQ